MEIDGESHDTLNRDFPLINHPVKNSDEFSPPLQRRGIQQLKQTLIHQIRQRHFQIWLHFHGSFDGENGTFLSCPTSAGNSLTIITQRNSPPLEGWQKFKEFLTGWFLFPTKNLTLFEI